MKEYSRANTFSNPTRLPWAFKAVESIDTKKEINLWTIITFTRQPGVSENLQSEHQLDMLDGKIGWLRLDPIQQPMPPDQLATQTVTGRNRPLDYWNHNTTLCEHRAILFNSNKTV